MRRGAGADVALGMVARRAPELKRAIVQPKGQVGGGRLKLGKLGEGGGGCFAQSRTASAAKLPRVVSWGRTLKNDKSVRV
jgi:hypothetical protein